MVMSWSIPKKLALGLVPFTPVTPVVKIAADLPFLVGIIDDEEIAARLLRDAGIGLSGGHQKIRSTIKAKLPCLAGYEHKSADNGPESTSTKFRPDSRDCTRSHGEALICTDRQHDRPISGLAD